MWATIATDGPSDAHDARRHSQRGFTLIELMIVVAIIGILAAMAIPACQDFTIRAQVTQGLSLASDLKAGVATYVSNNRIWPADETALGFESGARRATQPVTDLPILRRRPQRTTLRPSP